MPRSRPPKLTPAIQRAIAKAVAAGVPVSRAAILANVHPETVLEWMRRGEGRDDRPSTPLYANFASAIARAKALDEERRVARINQAGQGGAVLYQKTVEMVDAQGKVTRRVIEERKAPPDWAADAWHLERSRPDDWGRKDRIDLHHFIAAEVKKISEDCGLSDEEKAALIHDVEAYANGRP
jgi:hypothetical protein